MSFFDNLKKYVRGDEYEEDELAAENVQDEAETEEAETEAVEEAVEEVSEAPAEKTDTAEKSDRFRFRPRSAESAEETAPARRSYFRNAEPENRSKVVNVHTSAQLSVILVSPERYENAAEIADQLKDKRTVVLNLEKTNRETARRLLDFLSGVAFANEGKIKRVANSTYIITPYNVEIKGDLLDELENSGLYM